MEYKAGQISKATALLEKSLKHDPKNKAAQSNLAAIYHNQAISYGEQGKHEQEIQQLNKALSVAPDNQQIKTDLALAYNDHAVSLEKKGETKQQISLLTKAGKLAPDNKVIKENLTRAKEKEISGKPKDETKQGAKK
jgi:tetratricopeptide (TPR) repeat protein